jgi:hypothetical protein
MNNLSFVEVLIVVLLMIAVYIQLSTRRSLTTKSQFVSETEEMPGDIKSPRGISGVDIIKSQIPEKQWSQMLRTEFPLFNQTRIVPDDAYDDEENEKVTPFYRTAEKTTPFPLKEKIDRRQLVSQEFDCPSSNYILTYKNSQPHSAKCDVNIIRRERENVRQISVDNLSAKSLRKDYDYIDL